MSKTALVTGASSGIGAAIAHALRLRGFEVVGTSRRGGLHRTLDVTDDASIERVVRSLPRLDVLVNNAGVMLTGAIEETEDAQAHALFDVNFFGVARVTTRCLPLLRASRGRIVNIGSIACGNALPLLGYYAATKHALLGYTEALRAELKPLGVDVCLVEPSDFRSRLFVDAVRAAPLSQYASLHSAMERFMAPLLERAEDPAIVGRLVAHLACAADTPLRSRVGTWGRRLPRIKALLPQRAFERLMARGLSA